MKSRHVGLFRVPKTAARIIDCSHMDRILRPTVGRCFGDRRIKKAHSFAVSWHTFKKFRITMFSVGQITFAPLPGAPRHS